jgi:hypothetical protein
MLIRNKESGETIEVMEGSIIAESAWEVVEPELANDEEEDVEASDDKDTKAEPESESEAEVAGKKSKK